VVAETWVVSLYCVPHDCEWPTPSVQQQISPWQQRVPRVSVSVTLRLFGVQTRKYRFLRPVSRGGKDRNGIAARRLQPSTTIRTKSENIFAAIIQRDARPDL